MLKSELLLGEELGDWRNGQELSSLEGDFSDSSNVIGNLGVGKD